MTIGDLIKNKDYDSIEYRILYNDDLDIFAGVFASKNGEIISLDGDTYSKGKEVYKYEEWSNPEENIQNGLTVIIKVNT